MGASDRIFSRSIPKERIGEATSWEFQSLSGGKAGPSSQQARGLLSERERRAFDRGVAQGRHEGFAAGTIEAQRQQSLRAQRLELLLREIKTRFTELETAVADATLDLAIEIARQVIRRELHCKRDVVLPALRDAVALVIDQHAHPRVHVHPDDLDLIKPELDSDGVLKGCRFVPDPGVGRGGCRVETAQGEVDATLQTRWARVVQALGVADAGRVAEE